jgi:hypothetical protein
LQYFFKKCCNIFQTKSWTNIFHKKNESNFFAKRFTNISSEIHWTQHFFKTLHLHFSENDETLLEKNITSRAEPVGGQPLDRRAGARGRPRRRGGMCVCGGGQQGSAGGMRKKAS